MSTIGTGFTNLPDPKAAAAELVEKAKKGLEGKPTLAILISTVDYDLDTLVGTVQAGLGDVPMFGGTSSSGVFAPSGWITGLKGAASLMLLTGRPAGVGVALVGDDALAAGKTAAEMAFRQAGGKAKAFLTMPVAGKEDELLAGINAVAPGVPVVGGATGEHGTPGTMRQFANGKVYQGAYTTAAIGGEAVGAAFTHGYHPTGKTAKITKAAGRRIVALDGRPALEVYKEWTGLPAKDVEGGAILVSSTRFPLILHVEGTTLTSHPVGGNPDGSIDTAVTMKEGLTIELMTNTLDGIIAEVSNVVRLAAKDIAQPKAVFLSHCAGRALALGDRIGEVTGQVRTVVGDVPMVGFLAYGEQGCLSTGSNKHGNLSLAALVIGKN